MELKCLKYGCEVAYKYGHMRGNQRYRCKNCAHQYTKTAPRGEVRKMYNRAGFKEIFHGYDDRYWSYREFSPQENLT